MELYKKSHNMKAHLMIGAAVLAVLWYINLTYKWLQMPTDYASILTLFGVGMVYALAPDIDQQGSIINKYFTTALVVVIIYAFFNQAFLTYGILAAVIIGLLEYINHRTILHSVLGGLILAAPMLYLGIIYFIVAIVMFMSHLFSDDEFSIYGERRANLWQR